MADTADRILNDLRRRRDELKPLVGELERIEAAIDALERAESPSGSRANGSTAAKPADGRRRRRGRPRGSGTGTGTGSGRGSTGPGAGGTEAGPNRTDQFLALVRRGAISIPAAARELGIGPNYLYRIAATLESEGTIRKQGRDYVMNVESTPSENAETLPEPDESGAPHQPATPGRDEGGDDDLIADEGVNEGTREIIEE
jgi:hypothetical protein